ncbi:MAG: hypothetical protein DRR19_19340 [Candidatus Parabeggiatoa sp. nov. 1]|nr:MAG: hypothetical protein DRR19_19340 [Gammaproteobacteria bacterium]
MKNTLRLKTLLLLGFMLSITTAFFIGYSLSKTPIQNENVVTEKVAPVIDTAPIQAASSKVDAASNKIDSAANKLETVVRQLETISEKTLAALASLEKPATQPAAVNEAANTPSPVEATPPQVSEEKPDTQNTALAELAEQTDEETYRKILGMLDVIDYDKVDQITEGARRGEITDMEQAIQTLARIGTPEVKAEISKILLNEDEDMGIRLTAVEALDWRGSADELTNIFQTDSSHEIRLASVYAARETQFDEVEKEQVNQTFFDSFQQETNDFVRLAILDYFSDNQPEQVEQLLTLVPPDQFSQEVREQVDSLQNGLLEADNEGDEELG